MIRKITPPVKRLKDFKKTVTPIDGEIPEKDMEEIDSELLDLAEKEIIYELSKALKSSVFTFKI